MARPAPGVGIAEAALFHDCPPRQHSRLPIIVLRAASDICRGAGSRPPERVDSALPRADVGARVGGVHQGTATTAGTFRRMAAGGRDHSAEHRPRTTAGIAYG